MQDHLIHVFSIKVVILVCVAFAGMFVMDFYAKRLAIQLELEQRRKKD